MMTDDISDAIDVSNTSGEDDAIDYISDTYMTSVIPSMTSVKPVTPCDDITDVYNDVSNADKDVRDDAIDDINDNAVDGADTDLRGRPRCRPWVAPCCSRTARCPRSPSVSCPTPSRLRRKYKRKTLEKKRYIILLAHLDSQKCCWYKEGQNRGPPPAPILLVASGGQFWSWPLPPNRTQAIWLFAVRNRNSNCLLVWCPLTCYNIYPYTFSAVFSLSADGRFYASCTPTCACVKIHVCARAHPLGAAPKFHACAEKKDKSAHAHVGVHEALLNFLTNS